MFCSFWGCWRPPPSQGGTLIYLDPFKGVVTITRRTRGDDIDAACGQLAGKVQDRIRRAERRGENLEAQP